MEPQSLQTVLTKPEPPRSKWSEILTNLPILQFVGAGIIGLVATWTTVQLTQNSQASEIRRNAEKIEKLEKESVSRELFDERTMRILDEQKKQSAMLERILIIEKK